MTATLVALAVVVGRFAGARVAMYTVLVFASSAMVIVSAKMCLTDAVLLLFITGGQICLLRIYGNRVGRVGCASAHADVPAPPDCACAKARPTAAILLWVFIGLAGLTKGPFVLMVLGATMVALAVLDVGRDWRSLRAWRGAVAWWRETRPLTGIPIVAIIVAPWLATAYHRDRSFFVNMFMEPVRHMTADLDGGQIPSLFSRHFLMIWVTFLPWSIFLPAALAYGWRNRNRSEIRFALATIVGVWLCGEMMSTRLPHYLLPIFSSLAYLCGAGILPAACGAGILPASAVGCASAHVGESTCAEAHPTPWILGLSMFAIFAIAFGLYFPRVEALRLPYRVGQHLKAIGATGENDVCMIGFTEPSLGFYQGGTIRPRTDKWLNETPAEQWPRWLALRSDVYDRLPPEKRGRLREVGRHSGFNYNVPIGMVTVLVLEKTTTP